MPNWCANTLTLTHADPTMIVRAKESFERGELLNEFIPVPEDLKIESSPGTTSEELQAQYDTNAKKHGYSTWYDFSVGQWGTKWDIGSDDGIQIWDDNEITFYFDSAWSPPIIAYETFEELGFKVYATYYESGMCYCGIYEDGHDDYYDLSDMTAQEVVDTIPQELDESFGISECMAEYEAENQDEVTEWYKDGVEETGLVPHEPPKKEKK